MNMLVPSASPWRTAFQETTSAICNRFHLAQIRIPDQLILFLYHRFVNTFLHSSFLKLDLEIFWSLGGLSSSLQLFLLPSLWVWMHSCSQWYWAWISIAAFSFTALMFDSLLVFLFGMVNSCDWTWRDNHRDFVQNFIRWFGLGSLVAQPVLEPLWSHSSILALYSIQESFTGPL